MLSTPLNDQFPGGMGKPDLDDLDDEDSDDDELPGLE